MFVLQEWVSNIGLKMQSILLSGLRAPDQNTLYIKKCVRWMRSKCQVDADPGKQSYMQLIDMNQKTIEGAIEELEYCTVHYAHHFADAMAVLSYFHPDQGVSVFAYRIHALVAEELFHFIPESENEFRIRHADKIPNLDADSQA